MHGRKRAEYKARQRDPALSAATAKKAEQWCYLSKELLARRGRLSPPPQRAQRPETEARMDVDEETLKLTEKLLSINPDPGHLWNHRRELLLKKDDFDVREELTLTEVCLKRNPKAYAAWFHRKYSIRKWFLDGEERIEANRLLASEMELCGKFLSFDERNFHCWNYRRFVVSAIAMLAAHDTEESLLNLDGSWLCPEPDLQSCHRQAIMGPQLSLDTNWTPSPAMHLDKALIEQEWCFTLKKIESNFSNYSAFHYRSKLIPLILPSPGRYDEVLALAKLELDIVQNAIFTEPDDQTAWWYHRFVVDWSDPSKHSMEDSSYLDFLREDVSSIRVLLDMEDGKCKWALLALHMLLNKIATITNDEDGKHEANDCLEMLNIIDPDRGNRYDCMKYKPKK